MKTNYIFLFTASLFASWIGSSYEDCRVLAECDGRQPQWRNLTHGGQGRPGKQGATGPAGPKGEPGIGVNVTELTDLLKGDQKGPKLYYYMSTVTWETGKTFCAQFERTLCTLDQLCPSSAGERRPVFDVMTGDFWIPILDTYNDWIEIGDHYMVPCISHVARWGVPSWGTRQESRDYTGYVYCCEKQETTESTNPNIKYQYIGKSATYVSSRDHCVKQGRRLCYTSEVCNSNKPVLGSVKGDKWIAVQDRFNDWIQIGNDHERTCKTHGVLLGLPAWGVRQDGSQCEFLGYVYCCKNTEEP